MSVFLPSLEEASLVARVPQIHRFPFLLLVNVFVFFLIIRTGEGISIEEEGNEDERRRSEEPFPSQIPSSSSAVLPASSGEDSNIVRRPGEVQATPQGFLSALGELFEI